MLCVFHVLSEYSEAACGEASLVSYTSALLDTCYNADADPYSEVVSYEVLTCGDGALTTGYFGDTSCSPEASEGDDGGAGLRDCVQPPGSSLYEVQACSFAPSGQPSSEPSGQPSREPSGQPSSVPTGQPTELPLFGSTSGFVLQRFYESGSGCASVALYQEIGAWKLDWCMPTVCHPVL